MSGWMQSREKQRKAILKQIALLQQELEKLEQQEELPEQMCLMFEEDSGTMSEDTVLGESNDQHQVANAPAVVGSLAVAEVHHPSAGNRARRGK